MHFSETTVSRSLSQYKPTSLSDDVSCARADLKPSLLSLGKSSEYQAPSLCWDGTASLALHFGGTVESFLPLFTGVMMKRNLYGVRFEGGVGWYSKYRFNQ